MRLAYVAEYQVGELLHLVCPDAFQNDGPVVVAHQARYASALEQGVDDALHYVAGHEDSLDVQPRQKVRVDFRQGRWRRGKRLRRRLELNVRLGGLRCRLLVVVLVLLLFDLVGRFEVHAEQNVEVPDAPSASLQGGLGRIAPKTCRRV